MSAPADLPRGPKFVRDLAATLGPQQTLGARARIANAFLGLATWDHEPDGTIVGVRRDALAAGAMREILDADLIRRWGREKQVGVDPGDPYLPLPSDDPETAAQIAAEVAELVRAEPVGTPMLPTLTPAAALARQLVRTRELVPDGDRLRWRLRYADPALGGVGSMPPPPDRSGVRAPECGPTDAVTAGAIEHVVRTGGFLSSHAAAPAWADVLAELRVLAGLPSAPSAPSATAGDAGPTGWLRRLSQRP